MNTQPVLLDTSGPIAHVRLNRPGKLNSLTLETLEQLVATAHRIRADKSIRAVIISGTDHNFTAGLDFATALKDPARVAKTFLPRPWRGTNTFQEAVWAFRRLPVPVIAAVEGYCFGGGVQIALGADYRFTTADAKWSVLEAKWGLIPDMSGIYAIKQLLPIDTAKRLAMTGEVFSGERAAALGLASEIHEDPETAARELAEQIATRSPDSVAQAKRIFDSTWTAGERRTFLAERLRQMRLLGLKNTAIARTSALKKQVPSFRPRSGR
ncbi:crotonase/enoyl-CoA hydratase family protein [Corynebacterium heidelbergense]|uniref:Enoyl-CoA hydratase n=1 Tax=Corynebacterium heidelbergense TaxID=2055947 RepID=A0A364VCR0_9CORY|nr:crotonase/enoyl-CoA hydratase family protein [Corynebacterium heidelbergense]RAV34433.1 enoyl-CoA hydratase [Corynebacterium heidelbergense]WCZ37534.1 Carnitinyl-CoA dehydratase [Corynebacterium heidelbergense]